MFRSSLGIVGELKSGRTRQVKKEREMVAENRSGILMVDDSRGGVWGLAAGAVAVLFFAPGAEAAQYQIDFLTPLPSTLSRYLTVSGVNDAGAAVGDCPVDDAGPTGGSRVLRWDGGQSAPTVLPVLSSNRLGAADGFGYGINNSGAVVGSMFKYDYPALTGPPVPVLWPANGTSAVGLGLLSGGTGGYAHAINDRGDVVGYTDSTISGGRGQRAVRWSAGGTTATALEFLGTSSSSGQTFGTANAINSGGVVVGSVNDYRPGGTGQARAVRWAAGGTAVFALPIFPPGDLVNKMTSANAINDAGTIVGSASFYTDFTLVETHAARWSADGATITDLGIGNALGINSVGDAVGYASNRPVLWPAGATTPIDLNSVIDPGNGWTLGSATDISDTGIIVGLGSYDPDGAGPLASVAGGYRMIPVPEPHGTVLLGSASLGLRRRWRERP
jgi:uncharacterized membrane protein